jgi:two-component system, NarL family, invasion response regulator UvrY
MIRVVLVDDHAVVRAGISRILESEPDVEVVAQTGSGHEAVRLCRELRPDVVLLDFSLPDLDGLEVTRQIVDMRLPTRVLILTMYASEEYAYRLLRVGAAGFLLKGAPAEELLLALRKVVREGRYVTPSIVEKLVARIGQRVEDAPESALSDREMQVLVRLASGLTTREVAEELSLSLSTVETYRARVLEKLGLRNTVEITRFAIRRGLVDPT